MNKINSKVFISFLTPILLLISILFFFQTTRTIIISKLIDKCNYFKFRILPQNNNNLVKYKKILTPNHFIVAGHAYGNHQDINLGINHKLFNCLKQTVSDSTNFIVFTGDVVRKPNEKHFSFFKKQMDTLKTPFYIALGNHDNSEEGRKLMNEKYGNLHYTFKKGNNQFIFLNTENNKYEPSIDQIHFLDSILNTTTAANIFLFSHKLMWVNHSPINNIKFDNHGKKYFNNIFWKKIFPKLVNTKKEIYCIAGDVGGHNYSLPASYEKIGNVRLISSGMGHVKNENILIISTNKDSVNIKPMLLKNGELIQITDFLIPPF